MSVSGLLSGDQTSLTDWLAVIAEDGSETERAEIMRVDRVERAAEGSGGVRGWDKWSVGILWKSQLRVVVEEK